MTQKKAQKRSKNTIPQYSLAEELINAISHGIGAGLAIAALVLLCIKAHSAIGVVTGVIYASIMIILFIISCIYHSLSPKLKGKKVLRVIDHANVLLMVAGTYTPICLALIKGGLGWVMFAIVWAVTALAVVLNCIDVDKYQIAEVFCCLVIGWGSLLVINRLIQVCPKPGMILLIVGGIVYSIGAILYGVGHKVKYMHSVFHFFVLGGAILHFFLIYFYVV